MPKDKPALPILPAKPGSCSYCSSNAVKTTANCITTHISRNRHTPDVTDNTLSKAPGFSLIPSPHQRNSVPGRAGPRSGVRDGTVRKYANLFMPSLAGMAELADAADSKSAEVHPSWGFDPPSRHHPNATPFWFQVALVSGALSRLLRDVAVFLAWAIFNLPGR